MCYYHLAENEIYPGVAKFGIALEWGSRGLEFESRHSDHAKGVKQMFRPFFPLFSKLSRKTGFPEVNKKGQQIRIKAQKSTKKSAGYSLRPSLFLFYFSSVYMSSILAKIRSAASRSICLKIRRASSSCSNTTSTAVSIGLLGVKMILYVCTTSPQ